MKILFILLVTGLFSCSKEKMCYECQVANYTESYCGDIRNYRPLDAQGNELSYMCQPK